MSDPASSTAFPQFDRSFIPADGSFTVIGNGEIGGKAKGLALGKRLMHELAPDGQLLGVQLSIPTLTVLATDVFEDFLQHNNLNDIALSDEADDRIAHAFVRAELPPQITGDLWALVRQVTQPLAVRSSSLLEDALAHPFAGTFATKMISNNAHDPETRFHKLGEAIKLVWASTFFRDARQYMQAIGRSCAEERMAVIIQEVVGQRHGTRFYPTISGVARTFNFYPTGPGRPDDGVVNLAMGLGKQIVDGGVSWNYCPAFPAIAPPAASPAALIDLTQRDFWSVNMGPAMYDPCSETEYLAQTSIADAEEDGLLPLLASTYDGASDRLVMGTSRRGPRVLTFAPLLDAELVPLNDVIRRVAEQCKTSLGSDVEIEFAATLTPPAGTPARFGFLQVRPMRLADDGTHVDESELRSDRAIVASELVLGNGTIEGLGDVVYVRPDVFEAANTPRIAGELAKVNRALAAAGRTCVLIGFGRWGSSDPWLGIPVTWPQISTARVIVESTLPGMDVDPSQGSHFFHNLTGMRVLYLTLHHSGSHRIAWDWLASQPAEFESELVRHVRIDPPLRARVDSRAGRGVIERC